MQFAHTQTQDTSVHYSINLNCGKFFIKNGRHCHMVSDNSRPFFTHLYTAYLRRFASKLLVLAAGVSLFRWGLLPSLRWLRKFLRRGNPWQNLRHRWAFWITFCGPRLHFTVWQKRKRRIVKWTVGYFAKSVGVLG